MSYACNYVYPGCTGVLIQGICFEDCSGIVPQCLEAVTPTSLELVRDLAIDLDCGQGNYNIINRTELSATSECFNISGI